MSFARVRALVVIGVLLVSAVVFVVVALVRDTQEGAPTAEKCPEGYVLADIALPAPKDVKLNVLNATNASGLGSQVTEDFRNRLFQVKKTTNNPKVFEGIAIVRYGPKAVGAGHLLRAYFLDEAKTEYDRNRKDDVVDVVIGTEFQQLGTTTEVSQSLAALGNPVLPEGACDSRRH